MGSRGERGEKGRIRRKERPTRRADWGDQQAERRRRITNVSVGHMWVPRGLIRSAGSLIYAIVNPVKLCHKYRLMPPLRPADVITAELALHNFCSPFSVALFSVFFFFTLPHSRGTCPSFRCISCVPTATTARRLQRVFPFSSRSAHTRPKFPITLLLSLSILYSLPSFRVGPTLSRFKSITHSWEMITVMPQLWETAAPRV